MNPTTAESRTLTLIPAWDSNTTMNGTRRNYNLLLDRLEEAEQQLSKVREVVCDWPKRKTLHCDEMSNEILAILEQS